MTSLDLGGTSTRSHLPDNANVSLESGTSSRIKDTLRASMPYCELARRPRRPHSEAVLSTRGCEEVGLAAQRRDERVVGNRCPRRP